jgi:ribulose-5-phosphate 4-epimerase/fuculose-1-phosphate aldolase
MLRDHDKIIETVAEACRILGELEITKEALGHVSYHIPGTETMLIKGKGPGEVGLRFTQPRDIVLVDFNANLIEGPEGLQPPSESFLHIWQYKTRPEVQSVVHMHPRYAVLLSICDKEIKSPYGASYGGSGARFAQRGIPVYPRSITITNDELGQDLARAMGDSPVCLMRGHGVTVAGAGVEQAALNTIDLNDLCTMTYEAYLIGGPNPLPREDLEAMQRPAEGTRTRGSAGGVAGMMARWRYYSMLAERRARAGL